METVVVCNSCLQDVAPDNFFDECIVDEDRLLISLLDVPDSDFTSFLNPYSVIVRIKAFSCNFRDRSLMHVFSNQCQTLSGNQKYFYSPIGSEFVGEVVKTGTLVKQFQKGDRVMPDTSYPYKQDGCIGGVVTNFASQRLLLFSESQLVKVPDSMPDEVAAAFSISAQTAYGMVRKANLKDGANVLITGLTSNTSLAIIERLKSCNMDINVFGMSSKASKLKDKMKEWGLKEIFAPPFSLQKEMDAITEKFDVIFDPFIDLYFDTLSNHVNFNAKYIFCGLYQQHPAYAKINDLSEKNLLHLYHRCISYNISLIGNCLGCREDLLNAMSDYSEGKFKIHIDAVYTGTQLKDFFLCSFVKDRVGKIVYLYTD